MIIIINLEREDSKLITKRMVMAKCKVICGFTYYLRKAMMRSNGLNTRAKSV